MRITDRPPYPPYFHMHYHPDALAIMMMLRGVAEPPDPQRCRMLDLGCGTGASLQFYGYDLPGAFFHGVDLDARGIEQGQREVAELGLQNVKLECRDATTISEADGKYDFIVAHGFYSWVPDAVREMFWEIANRLLAENGVIYVSYNALPGSAMRTVVRDFLTLHHSRGGPSAELSKDVRGTLQFLSRLPGDGHLYRQTLAEEAEALLEHRPEQIVFDQLADENTPFYLHQVVTRAAQSGFQYVGESNWPEMSDAMLPKPLREVMAGIRDWPIRMQYRDFLEGCLFHRSLFCRKALKLEDVSPRVLAKTFVAAPLTLRSQEGAMFEFEGKGNVPIRTSEPLSIAALRLLAEAFPAQIHFDSLAAMAWAKAGSPGNEAAARSAVAGVLMELWGFGSATFSLHRTPFAAAPGPLPVAHPVARMRIRIGEDPANALGFLVPAEPVDRTLLPLLDGSRGVAELAQASGLSVEDVERRLERYARLALLTA